MVLTRMFGTGLTYSLDYLSDMVDHFRWTEARHHLQANPGHKRRFFTNAGLEVAHPFLDRDLVAFLMSVPGDQMMRDGEPSALLRAALGPSAVKAPPPHRPSSPTADDLLANWEDIHWLLTGHAAAVEAGFVDRAALTDELPHARISLQQGDERTTTALTRLLALELWLGQIAAW